MEEKVPSPIIVNINVPLCPNWRALVSTHRHPHDSPMTPDKELFSNQPRNLDFLFTATFVCIYFETFDNLDINPGLWWTAPIRLMVDLKIIG